MHPHKLGILDLGAGLIMRHIIIMNPIPTHQHHFHFILLLMLRGRN